MSGFVRNWHPGSTLFHDGSVCLLAIMGASALRRNASVALTPLITPPKTVASAPGIYHSFTGSERPAMA